MPRLAHDEDVVERRVGDVSGPGVAVGSFNTDGAGVANTTISGNRISGTTGAWVFIRQANPYSHSPQEFYTSDFIAKV